MDNLLNFEQTKRQIFTASETENIPVIDISALHSPYQSSKHCLKQIEKACTGTGFFTITKHGIAPSLLSKLESSAAQFFDHSEQFKEQYKIGSDGSHSGYVSFEDRGLYNDEKGDRLYEAFDLSLDLPRSDPDYLRGNIFYGPNHWPKIAGFKSVVDEYFQQVRQLSHKLVSAFETILGMPIDYMQSKMDKPTSQLRLIHYLASANISIEKDTSMGAHTDYELFTILHSKQKGLQTQNLNGEWLDVPIIEGALTVNIGDMLEVWSNGVFKSNLHRVINQSEERYSFPYFASLNYDTLVTPWIKEQAILCPSDYQSVVAGQHLLQQVTRDFSYLRKQLREQSNPFLNGLSLDENPYEKTVVAGFGE